MGVRARTASQVKTWWSEEDFNHTVNPLNHCWECNKPGHVRIECPVFEDEIERIFREVMKERNVKPREDPLLRNVRSLQQRVNNLKVDHKKTSYARFKVKQRNIFGLALIYMGYSAYIYILLQESFGKL